MAIVLTRDYLYVGLYVKLYWKSNTKIILIKIFAQAFARDRHQEDWFSSLCFWTSIHSVKSGCSNLLLKYILSGKTKQRFLTNRTFSLLKAMYMTMSESLSLKRSIFKAILCTDREVVYIQNLVCDTFFLALSKQHYQ